MRERFCFSEKTLMLGKTGQEEKGMTEDEVVGWHHRLDGHEFEQAPGVGDGQESLACYSPWGRKESDTTKRPFYVVVRKEFHWRKAGYSP